MQYLGISYNIKHIPALDPEFIPFGIWCEAYRKGAQKPLAIAVERNHGNISVRRTFIHGTQEMRDADYRYVLIGSGSDNYLWILSRTPLLSEEAKTIILSEAQRRGYDTDKLIWVRQGKEETAIYGAK